MRPISIPKYIHAYLQTDTTDSSFDKIKKSYAALRKSDLPDVSIVIPAYNEESNIIHTLASLCSNITSLNTEIIVVNNNSTDRTEEYARACGVNCIVETKQGITNARNAGLAFAKGTYILNADADTIYPKDWVKEMVTPLQNKNVAITYGRFSFIPVGSTGRGTYYIYEHLAEYSRFINRFIKDEAVNVYGFNSAFKRENGLAVEGFNHPPGTNEDGWLALKLRNKGFGKLYYVKKTNALVWTTDRRIQIDGGLWPGLLKRMKRIITRK